jgi:glycogen debranching enzyme
VYGGLGNVTNIDSNLWYLIAAHAAYFQGGYTEFLEEDQFGIYRRTLRHLESLDSDSCGFLEIPVGGDWTDILDWSYHVLYDQVLWYQALRCAAALFRERDEDGLREKLLRRAGRVRDRLNEEFWWDRRAVPEAVRRYYIHDPVPEETDFHYYQSHLKPFFNTWHHRFDAFGNTLAALAGIAPPERADRIIERVHERSLNDPYPLRVLDPPIQPSDPDWHRIYEVWEPPFEYHNGGVWPMAGGFWAMLLRERGRLPEAEEALLQLARSLKVPGADGREWAFHEYFHGRSGAPMGHRFQSWNAGSFLLAYITIREGKPLVFGQTSA